MANYRIDKAVLLPYLPLHTELDLFEGECFVSLIGFLFKNTRIKGLGFPFHRTFEEINLRFYVRRKEDGVWKRGAVFIKEIVPMPIITLLANAIYDENYVTLPTKHLWHQTENNLSVKYEWLFKNKWNSMSATAEKTGRPLIDGSNEEFITEHYWGYAQNKRGYTTEYAVKHPRWNIHKILDYNIDCDIKSLYGESLYNAMDSKPASFFLADGSEIQIMDGKKLKA